MNRIIFFTALFLYNTLNAQVNKIDHFFASSPKAEKLFNLFKQDLRLPVLWNFKSSGSFSSGGLSLGNVALEFVSFDSINKTKFDAIALEPTYSVEDIILLLDSHNIAHDTIESNTYVRKDSTVGGWENLNLKNLLPDEAGLFIFDYKDRRELDSSNREGLNELKKRKGGALGIVLLKEIVVASINLTTHKKELAKLPGIINNGDDLYSFNGGPAIRLVSSSISGIKKIVVLVYSLAATKKYLRLHKLLGKSSMNSVYIKPEALEGLAVEFIDK